MFEIYWSGKTCYLLIKFNMLKEICGKNLQDRLCLLYKFYVKMYILHNYHLKNMLHKFA